MIFLVTCLVVAAACGMVLVLLQEILLDDDGE